MSKDIRSSLHDPSRLEFIALEHRCQGLTRKEISDKTDWSTSSIQTYLSGAYKKLKIEGLSISERKKIIEESICSVLYDILENEGFRI